jgi:plastocyanin
MKPLATRFPTLVGLVLIVGTLAACSGAAPANPTPPPTAAASSSAPADAQTVRVTSTNFAFSLDAARVPAGPVTFVLQNDGPAAHDFAIRGNGVNQKTPVIERGQSARLTVALKPGTYTYICTIPGHDHLGMEGTFTVA